MDKKQKKDIHQDTYQPNQIKSKRSLGLKPKGSQDKSFGKPQGKPDYDHESVEKYWQGTWQKNGVYEPDIKRARKPFYNLMMFPYPSAEGLHVGNMYAFCGSDIYGRYKRMQGFDVLEPIGLDGFGIHSENYALKINKHPMELAGETEVNFYRQLRAIGNGFAWSKKVETYASNYYKWTQWVFIQMFKSGLAYRGSAEVNWCPSCKTVLADEQVVNLKADSRQLIASMFVRGAELKLKENS